MDQTSGPRLETKTVILKNLQAGGYHSVIIKPATTIMDFLQRSLDPKRRPIGSMRGYCLYHIRYGHNPGFQNVWPSRCTAVAVTQCSLTRPVPVTRKCAKACWCAARCCGTIRVSAMERPKANSRDQPDISSAIGFQSVMRPVASTLTKASRAVSIICRVCCNSCCRQGIQTGGRS